MLEDDVTVPAGWYPDPMGLPQLRWWNNHAWTELTTEARPPLVLQEQSQQSRSSRRSAQTRVLYADDELPTRRQQREQREREEEEEYLRLAGDERRGEAREDSDQRDADAERAPLTITLREIDAPAAHRTDDLVVVTADTAGRESAGRESIDRKSIDEGDNGSPESFDDLFLPRSATTAVSAPTAQYERGRTGEPDGVRSLSTGLDRSSLSTPAAWTIALLPLLQLVIGLLLVVGFGGVVGIGFSVAALAGPYLAVIVLAIADRAMLLRAGHQNPAHWALAFLTSPVYLIARAMRLSRPGELGLGPVLVWAALLMLQVASIVVVPGMLISVIPTVFSAQAAQSVASEASILGAKLDVTCPSPPPLIIGQQFDCTAKSSTGDSSTVSVSLQRANGWIDWRVDDWGAYRLSR